jgi:hypothetical protein
MHAIVLRDVKSYSYAGMSFANPHAVTSVGGTSYTYDNNGNVTAIGSVDYTWDWRNRLASAERSGGGITTYGYDDTRPLDQLCRARFQPRDALGSMNRAGLYRALAWASGVSTLGS